MKKDSDHYDIIVIGAGSGGLNIAGFMNRAGFRVLLVDKSDEHIGGDCLNFGCVPSKALIHVARTVHKAQQVEEFGLSVGGDIDWKKVRAYIKEKQDIIRAHENADWFRGKGMTVVLGKAEFSSRNSITVNGKEYIAKKIVIVTGSRPRTLTVAGIKQVSRVLNNENVFDMADLPKRLLVIGGGPIGVEIAQALSFLGSDVTISDRGTTILGKEDPEITRVLMEEMKKQGVVLLMGSTLKEFISPTVAVLIDESGKEIHVPFDAVFVGIGRVLNTEGLALERAGIAMNERGGIKVDEYLRTTNKNVYLCGDVAGNFQFTHAAEMHAGIILNNFFSPIKKKFSGDHIAWTTYTFPEIASFGLWEAELKKRNIPYETLVSGFEEDDRAITDAYQYGKSKLFISANGKILGGTMVAPNAGELIQELILANTSGLSIQSIFAKTYPYPTASRINKRLITQYFAKKLTERSKKLLQLLYAIKNLLPTRYS
jgi:pyruvate/2-oxoglutarate dehydrogenase complex dihydrolipoamide dehydrogenase (E3) component